MSYKSPLNLLETEIAIKFIKDTFERELAKALKLTRVSAPLFVFPETGLNDNLNGYERAVRFDILSLNKDVEITEKIVRTLKERIEENEGAIERLINISKEQIEYKDIVDMLEKESKKIEEYKKTEYMENLKFLNKGGKENEIYL